MNQNLLYLVFKCRFNTKHSGWPVDSQGRCRAQPPPAKRASKTGFWRARTGISPGFPGVVHRVVHGRRRSSARSTRCRFATAIQRVALQCACRRDRALHREDPRRAWSCSAASLRRETPANDAAHRSCARDAGDAANIRVRGFRGRRAAMDSTRQTEQVAPGDRDDGLVGRGRDDGETRHPAGRRQDRAPAPGHEAGQPDAPARGRVAGVRGVVSAHERDRERRTRVAPGPERRIERGIRAKPFVTRSALRRVSTDADDKRWEGVWLRPRRLRSRLPRRRANVPREHRPVAMSDAHARACQG